MGGQAVTVFPLCFFLLASGRPRPTREADAGGRGRCGVAKADTGGEDRGRRGRPTTVEVGARTRELSGSKSRSARSLGTWSLDSAGRMERTGTGDGGSRVDWDGDGDRNRGRRNRVRLEPPGAGAEDARGEAWVVWERPWSRELKAGAGRHGVVAMEQGVRSRGARSPEPWPWRRESGATEQEV